MRLSDLKVSTLGLIALAMVAGCSNEKEDAANATTADASRAAAPQVETFVIPDGTSVVASLDAPLSTGTNRSGDQFRATTTEPVIVGGQTILATGTSIHGTLRGVEASGRTSGRAQMTLGYDSIVDSRGTLHSISAEPLTLQAASAAHGDVEKIAAGGVLGAIIGGISGGGKGAAIGAGAGAGAGTILMLATKGDEVELASGQRVAILLTPAASIPALVQR